MLFRHVSVPRTVCSGADHLENFKSLFHRQIHPVCEDRTQILAYENKPASAAILAASSSLPLDPPIYPAPPPLPTYPLTPNICVEGGRIEFIKTPPDVAADRKFPPTTSSSSSMSSSLQTPTSQQAQTVTRAQQTVDEDEKTDVAKVGGSTLMWQPLVLA